MECSNLLITTGAYGHSPRYPATHPSSSDYLGAASCRIWIARNGVWEPKAMHDPRTAARHRPPVSQSSTLIGHLASHSARLASDGPAEVRCVSKSKQFHDNQG